MTEPTPDEVAAAVLAKNAIDAAAEEARKQRVIDALRRAEATLRRKKPRGRAR